MEYVRTMKEALALAVENRCVVWADQEGTIFDVEAMLTFLEIEKKLELPPDHYIAVSIEGAIGIADRYEFDIEWLFYPVLDEKVRQKYLDEFNRRVKEGPGKAASRPGAAAFCSYCGNQLSPGAKFCSSCGAKM